MTAIGACSCVECRPVAHAGFATVDQRLAYTTIDAWRRWRARRAGPAGILSPAALFAPRPLGLFSPAGERQSRPVLVALESLSATQSAALLAPATELAARRTPVALLAPLACSAQLAGAGYRMAATGDGDELVRLRPRMTLATSHAGGSGALAYAACGQEGSGFMVVQHGVLTPFAPPLPPHSLLLAWSDADAAFWTGGRRDVLALSVGSELLAMAARRDDAASRLAGASAGEGELCFLGQLHGPELPRSATLATLRSLRRTRPVAYRPHPGETDALSRAQHRYLATRGIAVERHDSPLAERRGAVVAIFSTGVLEAAAAGGEAWVACADPPPWVREVWDRYEMAPLDSGVPTVVDPPEGQPASLIADLVEELCG